MHRISFPDFMYLRYQRHSFCDRRRNRDILSFFRFCHLYTVCPSRTIKKLHLSKDWNNDRYETENNQKFRLMAEAANTISPQILIIDASKIKKDFL